MVWDNPFEKTGSGKAVVQVAAGQGCYANTRAALAGMDLSVARGKKVLLKPNAGRMAAVGSGIVTGPDAMAAAVDVFLEAGAEVAIGESPILGVKALEAFEKCGIAAVARARNLKLIDLDARPFVPLAVPDGLAIRELRVCPEVLEYDLVVSMPVMKMHMHTGVTLSVKNMKGCLWRRSKVDLHMLPPVEGSSDKSLDIAIADMSGVLRPHLAIIDGYIGMEGLGPGAGEPKKLDAAVVSAEPFAADAVACRLMGISAEEIPHLRIGAGRGYGIIDLDRISVSPDNWMDFASPFEKPPKDLALEFPGLTILDRNSCSSCQSTLLLFLRRYGEKIFDYFPKDSHPVIAIGKGHDEVPQGTLCLGNCTARHKARGIFVPGCPPVASAIFKAIGGDKETGDDSGSSSEN
ncbi:MAG: DUF362 domain-containing protein [Kiritimatiellia bacterium]